MIALLLAVLIACGGETGSTDRDAGPPPGSAVGEGCETTDDCRGELECIEGTCARERLDPVAGWPTVEGMVPMGVLPPDDVAHACGLLTGCPVAVAGVDSDFEGCFLAIDARSAEVILTDDDRALLECLAAATDCVAARACAGATETPCTASRCEGAMSIDCPDGFEVPVDCAVHGGTCDPGAPDPKGKLEAVAACNYGECVESRCDGSVYLQCDPDYGVYFPPIDCGSTGCHAESGCGEPGAECLEDRCDGAVAVTCEDNLETPATDCARTGAICHIDDDGFAGCVYDRIACGADFATTCEGTTLRYCARGVPASFDCASLGLACSMLDGTVACTAALPTDGP